MSDSFLELLDRHFNLEELRTLCFDLGIDYENLGGEGKRGKARELISYAKRRGRASELRDAVQARRPNVAWPPILAVQGMAEAAQRPVTPLPQVEADPRPVTPLPNAPGDDRPVVPLPTARPTPSGTVPMANPRPDAQPLPTDNASSSHDNVLIAALKAIFWRFPVRVGRVVQWFGARVDEMVAWLIGMVLIIVIILFILGVASGSDLLAFLKGIFGIQ